MTEYGRMIRRHFNGIRRPQMTQMAQINPMETAYDHVERQLLDQLTARIGVGGVHDLLTGLAQAEWERANQVVVAELERLGIHNNSVATGGG